jgi:hypothetical protein
VEPVRTSSLAAWWLRGTCKVSQTFEWSIAFHKKNSEAAQIRPETRASRRRVAIPVSPADRLKIRLCGPWSEMKDEGIADFSGAEKFFILRLFDAGKAGKRRVFTSNSCAFFPWASGEDAGPLLPRRGKFSRAFCPEPPPLPPPDRLVRPDANHLRSRLKSRSAGFCRNFLLRFPGHFRFDFSGERNIGAPIFRTRFRIAKKILSVVSMLVSTPMMCKKPFNTNRPLIRLKSGSAGFLRTRLSLFKPLPRWRYPLGNAWTGYFADDCDSRKNSQARVSVS